MNILKKIVKLKDVELVDGELREVFKEYICHFCLTHTSHRLFEEAYGRSIVSAVPVLKEDQLNSKFYRALAASCYIKIEGSKIIQNDISFNEFIDSGLASVLANDPDFIVESIELIQECMPDKDLSNKIRDIKGNNGSKK